MKLKLSLERNEVNGDVPTEYDLRITNMQVTNTFVFTEKDMPGYSSKMNTGGVKEGEPAIPARFLYQDRNKESSGGGGGGGGNKNNWGKPQRFQPYIRKAIPSKELSASGGFFHTDTESCRTNRTGWNSEARMLHVSCPECGV